MYKKPLKRITALAVAALTMTAMCLPAAAFASDSGVTKEETVYVVTDSAGAQTDVIVSDHLINKNKLDTISDETTLSDIENVKGEETFKQKGDALTWNAEGNGIYYQGKTTAEVPVTMDVVYRLNNKVVSGSELQGKSGKVEIKINYSNNATFEGTTVPFVVMTGMVVTDDSFKNVKITKGKVIDDGDKLLIVGMAAPGLAQTLDIGESDLGIGSSVTITGDAEEFAVEDMMTVVTNAFFEDIDNDLDDLDYDDEIKQLDKGAKALVDGSKLLYDGIVKMDSNMPALEDGIDRLKNGADQLSAGTQKAEQGASELSAGANQLKQGVSPLIAGLGTVAEAIAALKQGAAAELQGLKQIQTGMNGTEETPGPVDALTQISEGLDTISEQLESKTGDMEEAVKAAEAISSYMDSVDKIVKDKGDALKALGYGDLVEATPKIKKAADSLAAGLETAPQQLEQAAGGVDKASKGVTQVKDGLKKIQVGLNGDGTEENPGLVAGMMGIDNGLGQLNSKFSEIASKTGALSSGVDSLASGAETLASGEEDLANGAKALADGMESLQDKSGTLIDGVQKLDAGSLKVSQGMSKLYKQGIRKIVDMYNDDLKGTLDSARGMLDAGKGYKSFTRLPSNMDGNVKFIYKTDMTK